MKPSRPAKKSSAGDSAGLMATLQTRFAQNLQRHACLEWAQVAAKLAARPEKLRSLTAMEETGANPMSLASTQRPANSSSSTVPRSARQAA
jgi:hypothetical protein